MHQGTTTFRLMVSLLLVVAVPFCCCDFHAWLSACSRCDDHAERGSVVAAGHCSSDASTDEHDADYQSDPGLERQGTHPYKGGPCGPHHDDQNNCSCGKHDSKMLTGAKPRIEPPAPVLIAILDCVLTTDRIPLAQITINRYDGWATARPPFPSSARKSSSAFGMAIRP